MELSFETVGAALGFLSTGLIVWDRLIRNRPYARLIAKPFLDLPGASVTIYIEIVNPSRRPIIVRPLFRERHMRVSLGSDTRSIIRTAMGIEFTRVINAESSAAFVTLPAADDDEGDPDELVPIRFYWWPAQAPLLGRFRWPLTIKVARSDLAIMNAESHWDE